MCYCFLGVAHGWSLRYNIEDEHTMKSMEAYVGGRIASSKRYGFSCKILFDKLFSRQ